jgi:hypothetical protein
MCSHARHHVVGGRTRVEVLHPLPCHAAQQGGQGRVAKTVAHRPGTAIRLEVEGCRRGVVAQMAIDAQQFVQARPDLETGFGTVDGRLHHVGPGQPAVTGMHGFQQSQQARHAHRQPAGNGVLARHGPMAVNQELILARRRRRGLPAIEGQQAFACPEQQKATAADAARLRLDQRQHELRGHRGIDGVATARQCVGAGPCRQRMGGHHRLFLEEPRALLLTDARGLGLLEADGSSAGRQQQRRGDCPPAPHGISRRSRLQEFDGLMCRPGSPRPARPVRASATRPLQLRRRVP